MSFFLSSFFLSFSFYLTFFFFLSFCLSFSPSPLPLHKLHSVYTQLRGLLSASYSPTIKLLTVWLIVPQFDFGWGGERLGQPSPSQRCRGRNVADAYVCVCMCVHAVPRSVEFLRIAALSCFNRSIEGGCIRQERWRRGGGGGWGGALVLPSLLWSGTGHGHNGEIVQLGIS